MDSTMRAEAVEAMQAERGQHGRRFSYGWVSCRCGWDSPNDNDGELRDHIEAAVLDKLVLPQTVPCSECGGTGHRWPDKYGRFWDSAPEGTDPTLCEPCNGTGEVTLPPLALLMGELEQAEFVKVLSGHDLDVVLHPAAETLYRIAFGESSP